MAEFLPFLGRAVRYGLVGVLNTLVSLAVIAALDVGLHVRPDLANAAGYAVGVAISFTLARGFVFRDKNRVAETAPRYILVIATAFLLNQVVLYLALRVLGAGAVRHMIAQLSGMATYTVFSFLACNIWVFRSREAAP
jgi:putative flippase GtrA